MLRYQEAHCTSALQFDPIEPIDQIVFQVGIDSDKVYELGVDANDCRYTVELESDISTDGKVMLEQATFEIYPDSRQVNIVR